jgi:hypothetical protein
VPTFRALKELLVTVVTFGRLIEFRVLALALVLVDPVGRIDNPLTVVAVEEALALVKLKSASLELLPVNEESDRLKIDPEAAVPFRVAPAKVGVAVELMFWMVLTAPLLTVKLVELKLATPVVEVVALAAEITPVAETDIGAVPATATVPELSGIVIFLAAVGEVGVRVIELAPLVARIMLVPI